MILVIRILVLNKKKNATRRIKSDMIGMNAMFIHLQPSLPNNNYSFAFLHILMAFEKTIFTLYAV